MSPTPPVEPRPKPSIFRSYDPERDQRDKIVMLAHEQALAAGEKRRLLRTVEGELFSYRAEEIGFITGGAGAKITTGTGMLVTGTLCWIGALTLASFMFLVNDATVGERTGLYFVTTFTAAIGWYFMHLGRKEHRARKLRRARKLPRPLLGANLNLP